ncbi:hypothetical protein [Kitasatospora sp. NPDC004289]
MTRPLIVRVRGGHHAHAAQPSATMPGRLTTLCGKTKWAFRMHPVGGPVTCPNCLKGETK